MDNSWEGVFTEAVVTSWQHPPRDVIKINSDVAVRGEISFPGIMAIN